LRCFITTAVFVATLGLLGISPAWAGTIYTWNGGPGTWNTAIADWNAGGYTWTNSGSEIAQFGTGGDTAGTGLVTLGSNISALGLIFQPTFDGTSYTLTAPTATTLTLLGNGIMANFSATIGQTGDSLSVVLGAAQSWTTAAGQTLTVNSAVSNSTFLLTVNGGGNTVINGAIGSGSGGLTMSGSGTLTLNAANNFTGAVTLSSGVLQATNASALGTGAATLSLAGGALELYNTAGANFARNTTITGNTVIVNDAATSGQAGAVQTLGTLAMGAQTLTVWGGSNTTSGSMGLTFGALSLSASGAVINVYNSPTGITNTLTMTSIGGSGDNITFGASGNMGATGNVAVTGIIGTVGGTLTKNGTGTLTLSALNTYTGATTINGGTFTVTSTGGLSSTTPVTVASGTLNLNDASQTLASLTLGGGGIATTTSQLPTVNLASGTTLTLGGNITYATPTAAPVAATISGGTTIALGATRTVTVNTGSDNFAPLTISSPISGTGYGITKAGAGTLVLSGNNTYTGATTLSAAGILQALALSAATSSPLGTGGLTLNTANAELQLSSNAGYNFGNAPTVTANVQITSDVQTTGNAGATQTLGALTLNASTLTIAAGVPVGSGAAGITFGGTTLSATGATINVNADLFNLGVGTTANLGGLSGSGDSVTAGTYGTLANLNTGAITIGAGTLTKNGAGTLTMSGANTFTGAITINGGSVVLAQGGTMSGGNALTFGSSGVGTGSFVYNAASAGGSLTLGTLTFTGGNDVVQSNYGTGGADTLTFASLGTRGIGATGNFVVSGGTNGTSNSIAFTTSPGTGLVGAGAAGGVYYFNNADFAYYTGTYLRAPIYGSDPGFNTVVSTVGTTGAAQLTASSNNLITYGSGVEGVVSQTGGDATATISTIKLSGNTTLNANYLVQIQTTSNSAGGIIATGGYSTIAGVAGITSAGTGDLVFNVVNASDALTVNTQLTSGTTGGLTKTGAGTLFFNNTSGTASAFTGNIYVDGGTVSMFASALGTSDAAGPLGAAGARTIYLNGGTFQITGGAAYTTGTKIYSVGSDGGTLDIGNSVMSLTAAGGLTGTGNLTIGGNTSAAAALAGPTRCPATSSSTPARCVLGPRPPAPAPGPSSSATTRPSTRRSPASPTR
jgi:autotransporter-associated beta strand protein